MTRYPAAERLTLVDRLHGQDVADPYRWLEDPGDPRTRDWSAVQDSLWQEYAAGLTGRDDMRRQLTELAAAGAVSPPVWRGERYFVQRHSAMQPHPVLYTRLGDEPERVLLDPAALDPSGRTTLDSWQPDRTGRLLAYQISRDGTERAELSVLDVETGRVVDGPLGDCRYSPVVWAAAAPEFYYVRGGQVLRHRVGERAEVPVAVPGGGTTAYGLGISADGRWLAISAAPGTAPRNDLWLADLHASPPELRVVQQGTAARSACAVGRDGRLYIVTDREAPNIRLCVADPSAPTVWRELIPQDPEAVLADFAVLDAAGVLVVAWLRAGVAELTVHDLADGRRVGAVPLPGEGRAGPLSVRPDGAYELWFGYTDTVTPGEVWHYDHRTGRTARWAAAPGDVRPSDVQTTELTCASADGTPVWVRVLARPGSGPRPAILHGYGGFGAPLTPSYAADALSWVAAGGVLAIAHLRGGGEQGARSHRAGMGEHKPRVFEDFLAAAEALIDKGFTRPERLGIWGESNGGLLVGAALTRRPDLFAAAVCSAPLLDMVRYERWGLGPAWRAEYGSAADPVEFGRLLGYSPYHRVRKGVAYPATLFTVSSGDTRVDPAHARKMCAALQWATIGPGPVLLRRAEHAGHGARSTERALALAADLLAFVADNTGLGR